MHLPIFLFAQSDVSFDGFGDGDVAKGRRLKDNRHLMMNISVAENASAFPHRITTGENVKRMFREKHS